MSTKQIYVTGIGTDVGKTIVSAILTEALEADYWKPIQAGELSTGDSFTVKQLISNSKTVFHPNAYALKTPMSPHAAADIDGVKIDLSKIKTPLTTNHLIIEGAGGILVPINETETILNTIKPSYKVIVVSRHYLGSINHTLMTLSILKSKGFNVNLIFNGNKNSTTEDIIQKMSGITALGRINEETSFSKEIILKYASEWKTKLKNL